VDRLDLDVGWHRDPPDLSIGSAVMRPRQGLRCNSVGKDGERFGCLRYLVRRSIPTVRRTRGGESLLVFVGLRILLSAEHVRESGQVLPDTVW
jgi:hypothetical protein